MIFINMSLLIRPKIDGGKSLLQELPVPTFPGPVAPQLEEALHAHSEGQRVTSIQVGEPWTCAASQLSANI